MPRNCGLQGLAAGLPESPAEGGLRLMDYVLKYLYIYMYLFIHLSVCMFIYLHSHVQLKPLAVHT